MPARPMRLDCPRDRTPLVEREHEIPGFNVKADHCPTCEGVFLDANELKRLTGQTNINRLVTAYLGVDAGSTIVCPACGGLMDDEHFKGAETKTTIDVCLTCHGVWLDRGELEALAALDDSTFATITPEKRAELFDQDLAQERAERRGSAYLKMFAGLARGLRLGLRGLR